MGRHYQDRYLPWLAISMIAAVQLQQWQQQASIVLLATATQWLVRSWQLELLLLIHYVLGKLLYWLAALQQWACLWVVFQLLLFLPACSLL